MATIPHIAAVAVTHSDESRSIPSRRRMRPPSRGTPVGSRMWPLLLLLLTASVPVAAARDTTTATLTTPRRRTQSSSSSSSTLSSSYAAGVGLQSGPDPDAWDATTDKAHLASSFASSMVYHAADHSVSITGATFGSFFGSHANGASDDGGSNDSSADDAPACFLATVQLPVTDTELETGVVRWQHVARLGTPGVPEACNSILAHRDVAALTASNANGSRTATTTQFLLTGFTGRGGLLEPLRNRASMIEAEQLGMILDVHYQPKQESRNNVDNTVALDQDPSVLQLVGGRVLQESRVVYPVAASASATGNYVYIVSMESTSTRTELDELGGTQQGDDDATTSTVDGTDDDQAGGENPYPAAHSAATAQQGFTMTVERLEWIHAIANYENSNSNGNDVNSATDEGSPPPLQRTLQEDWRVSFGTHDGSSVDVSDILAINADVVIVVGSTTGAGDAFGGSSANSNGSMDGFVTKLTTERGKLVPYSSSQPEDVSATRIQSLNGRDDWVRGLCYDPADYEYFYIVGSTGGQLAQAVDGSTANPSIQAYLMKLSIRTLQPVWTQPLGADSSVNDRSVVRGWSCAVTPDGQAVYLAGVVEDGALLPFAGTSASFGGHDVFVAQYHTLDGTRQWVRQVGTPADDSLAYHQGVITDADGNAIILGNTAGSMYRDRSDDPDAAGATNDPDGAESTVDMFLMTLTRYNGAYKVSINHALANPAQYETDSNNNGVVDATEQTTTSTIQGMGAAAVPDDGDDNADSGFAPWHGLLMFLLLAIVGTLVGSVYYIKRVQEPREVVTDRRVVFEYLIPYDVEDVDLKHSATGGWHCSYANDLALGINRNASVDVNPQGLLLQQSSSSLASRGSIGSHGRVGSGAGDDSYSRLLGHGSGASALLDDSLFLKDESDHPYHEDDVLSRRSGGTIPPARGSDRYIDGLFNASSFDDNDTIASGSNNKNHRMTTRNENRKSRSQRTANRGSGSSATGSTTSSARHSDPWGGEII